MSFEKFTVGRLDHDKSSLSSTLCSDQLNTSIYPDQPMLLGPFQKPDFIPAHIIYMKINFDHVLNALLLVIYMRNLRTTRGNCSTTHETVNYTYLYS